MSNGALRRVVDRMKDLGAVSLHAEAGGSGDEGFIECVQAFDAEASELDEDKELQEAVEEAFDEHDYNYSDGDGGQVTLEIDLEEGTANWTDSYYETVLNEDGGESIDLDDLHGDAQ